MITRVSSAIELIIFDLDGTLYPPNAQMDKIYPQVAYTIAGGFYEKSTQEEVVALFEKKKSELGDRLGGRPTNTLTLLTCYPVDFNEFEEEVCKSINIRDYLKRDERVITLLRALHERYSLYLYTTNNEVLAEEILKHLGLDEFFPFDARYTYSHAGRESGSKSERMQFLKPATQGFLKITDHHGLKPENCLMVGDSLLSDINPAKKIGMQTHHISSPEDLFMLSELVK